MLGPAGKRKNSHILSDVMLFMQEAPLTKWQRNVLGIVRDEAYYLRRRA